MSAFPSIQTVRARVRAIIRHAKKSVLLQLGYSEARVSKIPEDLPVFWMKNKSQDIGIVYYSWDVDPKRQMMELNRQLLMENPEALEPLLAHEIAHYLIYRLVRPMPPDHGREWRDLCLALGGDGLTFHELDVSSQIDQTKYFKYAWRRGSQRGFAWFGKVKHNRAQAHLAKKKEDLYYRVFKDGTSVPYRHVKTNRKQSVT